VVVVPGVTVVVPDATGVTEPTPVSMLNAVAFVVVHERSDEAPVVIEEGDEEKVQVGAPGGGGEVTMIVAVQVIEPPAPVAVPVYVTVVAGVTVVVPDATGVTEPMLWSIENEVALVVVHERSVEAPVVISVEAAESTHVGAVGGGGAAVTVIVALHCTEPPAPVAVPVYVTVVAGVTVVLPDATGVTEPMLWSTENEVALVVVHESTDKSPVWIAVGFAERVQVGAGGGGGG
jgi:hypothetical protein